MYPLCHLTTTIQSLKDRYLTTFSNHTVVLGSSVHFMKTSFINCIVFFHTGRLRSHSWSHEYTFQELFGCSSTLGVQRHSRSIVRISVHMYDELLTFLKDAFLKDRPEGHHPSDYTRQNYDNSQPITWVTLEEGGGWTMFRYWVHIPTCNFWKWIRRIVSYDQEQRK